MAARRRAPQKRKPSAYIPWAIVGAVILAFVLLLVALARQPRLVGVGGHWHARYTIEVCGKILPPLPASQGEVHTHGDGVIHIHPTTAANAGRRANLETFFRTTVVRLTGSRITIPGGPDYKNGDRCPDGKPGTLRALVQHAGEKDFAPLRNFLRYAPSDRDLIRILFGP